MLNVLVVDDEPLALRRLQALCERVPAIGHVSTAGGGSHAMRLIKEKCPDLILLDVDMPDMSGMELAEQCRSLDHGPEVIFTTAHSKYAVQAFRLEAADYLLKPVKQALLVDAVEKTRKRLKAKAAAENAEGSNAVGQNAVGTEEAADQRLWVRDGAGSIQIRCADIETIHAERDYMRLCLENRSFLVHKPLHQLLTYLPADLFVQIHRSTVVRKDFINDIRRRGRRTYAVLRDNRECSIGARYRDALIGISGLDSA